MLSFVIRALKLVIRILPKRLLRIIEIYIQEEQGKGFVSNINLEVETLINLLPPVSSHAIYALDIGANQGSWTKALKARAPTARVDLFEPNIFHRASLEKLQSTESHISLFFVGLGDLDGEEFLYADSESSPLASLKSRQLSHINVSFKKIGKVQVKSLDSVFANRQNRPNVMKIDVEGYELKVLQGATELLKEIQVLQFEFGGTALDNRIFFRDFWDLLHQDFSIFRLAPFGLIEIRRYSEVDEVFRFTNYFGVRKTKL